MEGTVLLIRKENQVCPFRITRLDNVGRQHSGDFATFSFTFLWAGAVFNLENVNSDRFELYPVSGVRWRGLARYERSTYRRRGLTCCEIPFDEDVDLRQRERENASRRSELERLYPERRSASQKGPISDRWKLTGL